MILPPLHNKGPIGMGRTTAWESRGLIEVMNTYWVTLAVRTASGLIAVLSAEKRPVGPFSALANSLGLTNP